MGEQIGGRTTTAHTSGSGEEGRVDGETRPAVARVVVVVAAGQCAGERAPGAAGGGGGAPGESGREAPARDPEHGGWRGDVSCLPPGPASEDPVLPACSGLVREIDSGRTEKTRSGRVRVEKKERRRRRTRDHGRCWPSSSLWALTVVWDLGPFTSSRKDLDLIPPSQITSY